MCSTKATLIYLDHGLLISKKRYQDWREIQTEYWNHYQTSLAPMTCAEIIRFFTDDFGEESHWPFSKRALVRFFEGNSETMQSDGSV